MPCDPSGFFLNLILTLTLLHLLVFTLSSLDFALALSGHIVRETEHRFDWADPDDMILYDWPRCFLRLILHDDIWSGYGRKVFGDSKATSHFREKLVQTRLAFRHFVVWQRHRRLGSAAVGGRTVEGQDRGIQQRSLQVCGTFNLITILLKSISAKWE